MFKIGLPFYHQHDATDCGPACLRMIARYFGRQYSLEFLRERCYLTRDGVSLLGISEAAESIGLRTLAVQLPYQELSENVPLPCIVHWRQTHFVVVHRVEKGIVHVNDPAYGPLTYSKDEFLRGWCIPASTEGIALLLEPTVSFSSLATDEPVPQTGFGFLVSYLRPHRGLLGQLFLGMLLGCVFQLIFPFLTQSIVDFGITNQNLGFVYTVLLSQLVLFLGRTSVDLIRGRILLHIGTRIKISIISDFILKLTRLPLSFFDTKKIGDLLQRIGDHTRISNFLTSSILNILFSLLNLIIFSMVLAIYSIKLVVVFIVGGAATIAWVLIFTRRRRDLDYKKFFHLAENQSQLI